MTKFMQWYEMADSNGTFDMATMARRAKNRFDESVATNPQFYYGPYTGLIAHNAGYLFAAKLFRNYSSENPDGVLSMLPFSPSHGIWDSTFSRVANMV